jgi:hypothetical protein
MPKNERGQWKPKYGPFMVSREKQIVVRRKRRRLNTVMPSGATY